MRHTTPCEDSHRQYPQVVGSKQCVPQTRPKRILTSTNRVCWFEWVADSLCGWVWGCCEPGFATLALHYDTSKGTRYPSQGDSLSSPNGKFRGFWLLCKSRVCTPKVRTGVCRAYQPKPAKTQIWNENVSQFGPQNQKQFLKLSPSPETSRNYCQNHALELQKITRAVRKDFSVELLVDLEPYSQTECPTQVNCVL